MSSSTPAIRELACQLLALEPPRAGSVAGDMDPAVQACERLRGPLAKLAGMAGFASLLSRALAMAKRQAPWLTALRIEPDGSVAGWNGNQQDSGGAQSAQPGMDGGVALLAELLGLLVTFIGEPLTLRLVREAWPDAPIDTVALK